MSGVRSQEPGVDFAENPLLGLALEGSRLRLPEASRTPKAFGAASSAPPSFSPEDGFAAAKRSGFVAFKMGRLRPID